MLLSEASKAGRAAHDKIVHASILERENEVAVVRNIIRKGTNYEEYNTDDYVLNNSVGGDVDVNTAASEQAGERKKRAIN